KILDPKTIEGRVLRTRLGRVEFGQRNFSPGVAHPGMAAPAKLGNHILDDGQEEAPKLSLGAVGLLQELIAADPEEGFLDDVFGILVAESGLAGELVERPAVSKDEHLLDPRGVRTSLQDARPHGRG